MNPTQSEEERGGRGLPPANRSQSRLDLEWNGGVGAISGRGSNQIKQGKREGEPVLCLPPRRRGRGTPESNADHSVSLPAMEREPPKDWECCLSATPTSPSCIVLVLHMKEPSSSTAASGRATT
jgi:hypothetical protein